MISDEALLPLKYNFGKVDSLQFEECSIWFSTKQASAPRKREGEKLPAAIPNKMSLTNHTVEERVHPDAILKTNTGAELSCAKFLLKGK